MYKEDTTLNNLQWLICHKTQPNQILYLIYMYKEDLALNKLQWLICHKTKPNQTKLNSCRSKNFIFQPFNEYYFHDSFICGPWFVPDHFVSKILKHPVESIYRPLSEHTHGDHPNQINYQPLRSLPQVANHIYTCVWL